jgi:light-regulated signal transduction histidine kinase (bacteriophytochrome)
LDPENLIVDLNPGALRLMRQQNKNLIGRSALEVFSDSPDLIRRLENVEETHEEITIERDEISYVYELRITSLYDRRQQLRCRVLLIHNISQRLVEMMGGRIWVESEAGRGSRFHFTVQFETPT